MTSALKYKDYIFFVANMRFSSLIGLALDVGQTMASNAEEESFCIDLAYKNENKFFNGYSFSIEKEFPQIAQQKFWAKVFHELAQRVFLRQIGNQEIEYWQASFIGDCHLIVRLLLEAIRTHEPGWCYENTNGLT